MTGEEREAFLILRAALETARYEARMADEVLYRASVPTPGTASVINALRALATVLDGLLDLVEGGRAGACDACGGALAPTREPRSGERHYCAACRAARIPERDAQRDYRARQRASKEGGRR